LSKKTTPLADKTEDYHPNDSGRFLAQWLQEAGRRARRSSNTVEPGATAAPVKSQAPQGATRSVLERMKWPLIAAFVAMAYLQYFYADVMVQIGSLPAIIFFVLINGQLPPT
jgi:hypothetical protein